MDGQVYYEDVREGLELDPGVKYPTSMQLVKFTAASGDYYQIHYDRDFAAASGLPGVIVHGWLGLTFLATMVTDWMGGQGRLVELDGGYKGMNRVHEELFCYASVSRKYEESGEGRVRLELRVENPAGEVTVTGGATVSLPRRNAAAA
jgi:acyl dehydratase